jgi:hypothetical protein
MIPLVAPFMSMPVTEAASGSITINPTKFSSGVATIAVLNGGVFGSGATVRIYMSTDTTFTTGDTLVATVTLPAGQTSFINTVVSITPPSVATDTIYYIAATDDNGITWTSYVQVTVTTQTPTITLTPSTQAPGGTVRVDGSGFTPGTTVTIYLSRPGGTVLASTTAKADGSISVTFTVPNLAQGSYKIIAQQADTLQADATLTVGPVITAPFAIAGTSGETFTIVAAGLKGGKTIQASTTAAPVSSITVGGVLTYHSGGTTGADGTLTITVTLSASIPTTGFQTVVITYTDASTDTIPNAILVSRAQSPTAPDYSQSLIVTPTPGAVSVGDTLSIIAFNFPAGASVSVYFGSVKIATIFTDSLGAGRATATVPPLPGLRPTGTPITYTVRAIDNYGLQVSLPTGYTINRELRLIRADTGALIVSGTHVDHGTTVRLVARGLRPLYTYTLTESFGSVTYDIIRDLGGVVPAGQPGTITATGVRTDASGSFVVEFKVNLRDPATGALPSTGTTVTVSISPSDVASRTFRAVGTPAFGGSALVSVPPLSYYHAAPGATVAAGGVVISNLVPNTRYQLFIDGNLVTLGGTTYPDSFVSDAGGASPSTMTFAAPATPGIYTLSIRYYGQTVDLARIDLIVSSPALSDTAVLATPSIKSGGRIIVKAFNLPATTTVSLYVSGMTGPVATGTTTPTGAIELRSIPITLPAGSYNVRLEYGPGPTILVPSPSTVTVGAAFSLTPDSGPIGTSVTVTASGLDPNTAYSIVFGTEDLGVLGISEASGSLSGTFTVPAVLEGTYTVKLVQSSDPTKVVATATFEVTAPSGLVLTPNPSAFPGQLVTFEWDTGVATLVPPVYVTVLLNGYAYTTFPARYEGTKLYGSFQLPNAPAGTTWVLRLAYSDSRQTASWQTVASGTTTFSFQISVDEGTATDPGGFTIPPQDIATFAGIKLRLVVPFTGSEPGADVNVYTVPIAIWGDVVDAATDVVIGWFWTPGSVSVDEGPTPNEGTGGEGTVRVQISSFSFMIASGLAIVVTVGSIDTDADPYTGGSGTASGSTTFTVKSYALANNPQTGTSGPVVLRLVEGSGALVISVSDADVARIAGAVNATVYDPIATIVTSTGNRVLARLRDLNATIVEVRGGVALLNTRFGEMFANLSAINATLSGLIVSAKGDVLAKIDTALGPVLAKLDALNATLVAVHGDTAVIKTVVDNIKLALGSLNATIAGIKGDVVVIKTDVGFIKAKVEEFLALLPSIVEFVNATVTDIKSGIAAIKGDTGFVKAKVEDIIALLSAASTTLSNVAGNVSAVRSDIAAVRSDIAEVKALVLEVNTNVGFVAQAVLTVADQNKAVLDRLDKINATLVGVSGGVAKLSTDVAGLASLVKAANLSISQIVVDQSGRIVATLRDSEGRISGLITTNAKTLSDLITAVGKDVAGVADSVKRVSDTLATFQSGTFSKLDAISGSVDAARADLARLRTDAAAMASVVAGIQTTVSRVDTNVGGLVDAAKAIATTVDSINRAVPGLATKADVSGAQTAITGAIDKAKSDLQGAVKSAETAASTSSRNWGVINAILIIIAIAILAYSTFVARRA